MKDVILKKARLCSACQAGKLVGGLHPVKIIVMASRPLKLLHTWTSLVPLLAQVPVVILMIYYLKKKITFHLGVLY